VLDEEELELEDEEQLEVDDWTLVVFFTR